MMLKWYCKVWMYAFIYLFHQKMRLRDKSGSAALVAELRALS